MARIVNPLRITDARLINQEISTFGKSFAIQYDADGFASVDVTVQQPPLDIKNYLEGDNSIKIYAVASNVSKLCAYALASFPFIEEIYLFKNDGIVTLVDDLSYLTHLTKIYVPTALLNTYKRDYSSIASLFDTIVSDYTVTIQHFGGTSTTLTVKELERQLAMLSQGERNAVTKLVISDEFTENSAYSVVWSYNFSSSLPNLNNNIWYGTTQYDFTEYKIIGSGTLTSGIVEDSLDSIASDKISGITKVIIPIDFISYASGSITAIQNGLSNLRYLETTYSGGTINLDLQGDIVSEIVNENETLDNALVLAKDFDINNTFNQTTAIIIPPTQRQVRFSNSTNFTKLVLYKNYNTDWFNGGGSVNTFNNCPIVEIDMKITACYFNQINFNYATFGTKIKRLMFDFTDAPKNKMGGFYRVSLGQTLEKILLTDFMGEGGSPNLTNATNLNRQAVVDLINSLGTPATTQTLTIGATNLAKLTADDIAIATAKNWTLQ